MKPFCRHGHPRSESYQLPCGVWTCGPCRRAAQARWRSAHPDRVKANATRTQINRREKVVAHLGGMCVRCGITDTRVLQIDHIKGGGTQEYKRIGQSGIYSRVLRGEPGYQLLCANCNWLKRIEMRESNGRWLTARGRKNKEKLEEEISGGN